MADGKRLQRLHRVRTLQLNLARADEARAREQVTSEQQLSHRIAQLAAAVQVERHVAAREAHVVRHLGRGEG